MQTYSTQSARIDKLAGEIIGHAEATEVLTGACDNISMPKNKSENIIVRSWVPYGGTVSAPNTFTVDAQKHITQEGVTPPADTIVARDITFTLKQYMALYAFTDKQYDLYEDDVAAAMKEQTGERMGLVREMAIYGEMKACTNKFYAGGTTRATVDEAISKNFMQRIVRSLKAAHAKKLRPEISGSVVVGSGSVEASFVAYCHTDCEQDIRALPGFTATVDYGSKQLVSEQEIGTCEGVRYVLSPDLASIADSGASGTSGLYSTTGTNVDVYPVIVMAKDAFAQVNLRGRTALDPIWLPPSMQSKSDPGGQRGYVGAKFYHAAGVKNNGWMAVGEVAVSDLL